MVGPCALAVRYRNRDTADQSASRKNAAKTASTAVPGSGTTAVIEVIRSATLKQHEGVGHETASAQKYHRQLHTSAAERTVDKQQEETIVPIRRKLALDDTKQNFKRSKCKGRAKGKVKGIEKGLSDEENEDALCFYCSHLYSESNEG
ncbi:unnamed protein product [Acanthoscelides obtectus]|uniref:Uncharacterized protein n=1 Tax=Acanthoscelides obtectus TaxID=200917 RepID=A0A9P0M9B0_ACAOB|nr:unnamed protein product [Acanthoscelides obtectus]CAK1643943.1 hypothetical protein AOBTE_LOCUS13732 [Acanthoscelides obtectus]